MSVENVLALIQENEVKFVDLRLPTPKVKSSTSLSQLIRSMLILEEGKMFDGSSVAGWKGINESDMVMMPDAASAVLDPLLKMQP